jgi:hypothetical protein
MVLPVQELFDDPWTTVAAFGGDAVLGQPDDEPGNDNAGRAR